MFYGWAFFGVLLYNACLSVVFFAVSLVLGPALSQTLGATLSALLFVFGTLVVRFVVARYFAREMWLRSAPLRRIAFNVVVPAFVGHCAMYLPLVAVGALSTNATAVLGLAVDSSLVLAVSFAAILVSRKEATA